MGHHENDPVDGVYRSAEERETWVQFAPIERLEAALVQSDRSYHAELEAIRESAAADMDLAAAAAIAQPHPLPAAALRHVWREPLLPEMPGRELNMTSVTDGPSPGLPTQRIKWRAAVRDGIAEEFRRNPATVYFGEGTGERGGTYQHTAGLWEEFGAERIIDTGISELAFTGCSMGMAATGCRAIADTMTSDFMFEATSTLIEQAAKLRYMSGGETSVPMVMRAPAGNSRSNGPHHAGAYWPLWSHCPGLVVCVPAFAADAKGLIKTALRFSEDPVIFMETKNQFDTDAEVPTEEYYLPFGKASTVRSGDDVTLVACGAHVHTCLEAAEALSVAGTECEIIDIRTIVPMDTDAIVASVRRTGRLLVVDEAYSMCGIGAEVIAAVVGAEDLLPQLKAPPGRLHTAASAMPFSPALEAAVKVSVESVTAAVDGLFDGRAPAQTGPVVGQAEAEARDATDRAEEAELAGHLLIEAPFRAGPVSYLFGVPVTLKEWLVEVGDAVSAQQPVATISVEAEDMNKPGATVADDFEVLAPADGTVSAQLVAAGEPTELGKQVGALLAKPKSTLGHLE